jgi:hypothetical protein
MALTQRTGQISTNHRGGHKSLTSLSSAIASQTLCPIVIDLSKSASSLLTSRPARLTSLKGYRFSARSPCLLAAAAPISPPAMGLSGLYVDATSATGQLALTITMTLRICYAPSQKSMSSVTIACEPSRVRHTSCRPSLCSLASVWIHSKSGAMA